MTPAISYWLEISVAVDGEAAEAVSANLERFAHQGSVVIEQQGDPNDPDPNKLLDQLLVKIFIPDYEDTPTLRRKVEEALYYLGRLYPIPEPSYKKIAEDDWSTAWRKNYQPFRIAKRTWIQPSWLEVSEDRGDDTIITLDPGMAFGTGLHPSSQMCVQALEELVEPGDTILDVGTGSGILAIAAVLYGASSVVALDTDGVAVRTAKFNAGINGVGSKIHLFHGALEALPPKGWDVVVVNILAPVIQNLLQAGLLSYLNERGVLILSGIIEEQADQIENELQARGGEVIRRLVTNDWIALIAKQKAPYP